MSATIRVTGKGTLSLHPDTVRLIVTQEDTEQNYSAAVLKAAKMTGEFTEGMVLLGFRREEIKTLSFNVNSKYEYCTDRSGCRKRSFAGYQYTQILKLEFPADNLLLGKVLAKIADLSGSPEFRIEYTVKDKEAAKNALLAKAVADSRAKAELLCAAAGEALGSIVTIDYSRAEIDFVSRTMPMVTPYGDGIACKGCGGSDFDVDIEPEDIRESDSVTIIWNLA